MISKPDHKMRRGFWHADAWAAARAERPARWHTPAPDQPIASKIVVAMILLCALATGPIVLAITFAVLVLFTAFGNLLRRVLMYWSIRRYGTWAEMAPEIRETLANASDLAARPGHFAPLPSGFTRPGVPAAAPAQRGSPLETAVVIMGTLLMVTGLLSDLF